MELINDPIKTQTVVYVDTTISPCVKYSNHQGVKIPYDWCKKCEFYDESTKSHKYYKHITNVTRTTQHCSSDDVFYKFEWKCPFCGETVQLETDNKFLLKYVEKPAKCKKCGSCFATLSSSKGVTEFAVSLPKHVESI